MLTKYLNYSSWAAVYQNISFGFSFGLSWAQWFLLIVLMDYCDQIFLFFLIFPVILSLLQSVMILMTLLYLWHDCRDTFVGWVPCQDCLTSWCLTSPSVLTLGSCSAAVTRLRWEMKGGCSILLYPNWFKRFCFEILSVWKAKRLVVSFWQNIE